MISLQYIGDSYLVFTPECPRQIGEQVENIEWEESCADGRRNENEIIRALMTDLTKVRRIVIGKNQLH